ncbi:TonB-linked outer membrane protein, SusC/RagA family [Sphingobacterium nematocida]|uniref:TonB-linked outer membrane protein, SusC/RagA family n=1 Tax=Sphingobacterium nematocida TaxID=1513896 RepID=A0A1T5G404_9SPHI|nr:SusC/RagA family TonB-linked outer membrane protein [Sphingobacterium nematocida]SKC03117.1 TonB-linked outer membrane protein, SusC/RagA family [Sphingobacterium nematocida]
MRVKSLLFTVVLVALYHNDLQAKVPIGRVGNFASNQTQTVEVKGIVRSSDTKEPLTGVSVGIQGKAGGATTDVSGRFVVKCQIGDVLTFSMLNYKSVRQKISNSKEDLNIVLESTQSSLDEVVVIGYGSAKKSDLTGSITRVDAKQFQNQPKTQLTEMLNGTVAGFNSNQSTRAAGGGSMEIRGPKSLNASTDPMIVLDGVIFNGSLSDINPADIETLDILKDASSTAVYGARAAAGVIQVTTKKGVIGNPTINLQATVGGASLLRPFKIYDGEGYIQFRSDVMRAFNTTKPGYYYNDPNNLPSGVSLEDWRKASNNPQSDNTLEWLNRLNFFDIESDNYVAGKEVNWLDEVFRTGTRQDYDLSISGGAEKVKYYWSLGYQSNEGIMLGDDFKAIRTRLNTDFTINKWLSAGVNTQFSDRSQLDLLPSTYQMSLMSPYGSMYDQDGKLLWYPNSYAVANPLVNILGGQDQKNKINSLFASIYMNFKLPLDINYKISYQPRYSFEKLYNFYPSTTIIGGSTYKDGYGTRDEKSSFEWMLDHLVNWNKKIGLHQFDVTLLYSAEKLENWNSYLSNSSFTPNQNLGYHGIQYGKDPKVSSDDRKATGDAAMARLNYTLNDKYLFTASVRRDGYSAFGKKNPRAVFPAFAAAWRISNEPFFQVNSINDLKLRASWGRNGNRSIGAYAALAEVSSNRYYNGSTTQIGVYNSTLANYDLKWEQTESFNLGIDLSMFSNRIGFTADVYDMTTVDLLMNRKLPELTGYSTVVTNLGKLSNKGVEFTLNTVNVDKENFRWTSSFVYSANRNKIDELFGDFGETTINGVTGYQELPDYTNEWFPGQALDRVWNYRISGIWQASEAEEAKKYKLQPGDFKVEDLNGDYIYNALIDKQFLGNKAPQHRLGLRNSIDFLKDFNVTFFLRAELGHVAQFAEGVRTSTETYDKRSTFDFPYWTAENSNNEYARLNTNVTVFGGGIKVYKPASYLRLQDLSFSYVVPSAYLDRINVKSFRVFLAARNVFTIDNWPGWDPETTIPMPRTYSAGINFSL